MADNSSDDLLIAIGVDLATVRRSLKRLEGDIGKSNRVVQQQYDKLGRDIDGSFNRAFRSASSSVDRLGRSASDASLKIARVFAFAASTRGAQSLIDSSIKIQNSLKVAGVEGDNLAKVYGRLFASAQANAAPIDALATLYGRAATASKELGASQEDLLQFSDGIAKALRVSGQSAQESSSALLQLSQALGGGKIQAEEYNSLLDGGRPILQAVAAGLKEAGGSVSELTKLVKDGKVSSKAFFDAFLAGQPVLEKALAGSEQTISSRFVRLQNVLIDAAGKFNQTASAGNAFGEAIDSIADEIAAADFNTLGSQLKDITVTLQGGTKSLRDWSEYLGRISGLRNIGSSILPAGGVSVLGGALTIKPTATQEKLDLEVAEKRRSIERDIAALKKVPASEDTARTIAKLEAQLKALPEIKKAAAGLALPAYMLPGGTGVAPLGDPKEIKPVTLSDYPVGDDKTTEKAKKKYDDLVATARERNEELRLEIELIGQAGSATEAARNALELLQRAKRAGIEGDNLKAIEAEAETYRRLATALSETKLQQELLSAARFSSLSSTDQKVTTALRQYGLPEDLGGRNAHSIRQSLQQEEIADAFQSFAMQFSTGLISEGKSLGEAFGDAVKAAAATQMQKSLESLFSQIGNALASALMPKLGGEGGAGGAAAKVVASVAASTTDVVKKTAEAMPTGDIASYITQAAIKRGIDPNIALKVAKSEGGLSSWNLQSNFVKNGVREDSWGPFQLYKGGGLGNEFMAKTGLDPALAKNGPAGVDFALDEAKKSGWGAWYGAEKVGVGKWDGIGRASKDIEKLGSAAAQTAQATGGLGSTLASIPQALMANGGGSGLLSSLTKYGMGLFSGSGQFASAWLKGGVGLYAGGGNVSGPGGPRTDSIPALLSNGEFVINAGQTRKHRALLEAINSGRSFSRYADGGLVAPRIVSVPRVPRLHPSGSVGMVRNESRLTVQVQGASGDDHVRMLVNQGVQTALRDQDDYMRKQGFGNVQADFVSDRG